jgi:hypothetical protein
MRFLVEWSMLSMFLKELWRIYTAARLLPVSKHISIPVDQAAENRILTTGCPELPLIEPNGQED